VIGSSSVIVQTHTHIYTERHTDTQMGALKWHAVSLLSRCAG